MRPDRVGAIGDAAGPPFDEVATAAVDVDGDDPVLPTRWPVGDVAAIALAGAGVIGSRLAQRRGGRPGTVRVRVADAAAATLGFALMRVDGAPMERTNAGNPWVGRYRCSDGRWIHLHGGFPPLAQRLAAVLGVDTAADETAIAAATGSWGSTGLEDAIAERNGCAAIIRTEQEWRHHPQGTLVHSLPVVVQHVRQAVGGTVGWRWTPSPSRPLEGLRVLDLTRVLAGPTCGRTLAAFGADVLHVRSPDVPFVPAFVIDTGHGKRQAFADLTDPTERDRVREVALTADVVVQGWRPGVVGRFGLDEDALRGDGFAGVYGSVCAYGHVGPWAARAGWEQLAQSASGLCTDPTGDEKPGMLPCAATDYTTGFVLATGIMDALEASLVDGRARSVEASLCQTAAWILRVGRLGLGAPAGVRPDLLTSRTGFGTVEHLGPSLEVEGVDVGWTRPTTPLGAGALTW